MTAPDAPARLVDHQRGVRYREVLAVHARDGRLEPRCGAPSCSTTALTSPPSPDP